MKRLAILLFAFVALAAAAAEPTSESKHDKDLRECNAEADAAVAEAKLTSPMDVVEVRRVSFNRCMRSRAYATGPIRAK